MSGSNFAERPTPPWLIALRWINVLIFFWGFLGYVSSGVPRTNGFWPIVASLVVVLLFLSSDNLGSSSIGDKLARKPWPAFIFLILCTWFLVSSCGSITSSKHLTQAEYVDVDHNQSTLNGNTLWQLPWPCGSIIAVPLRYEVNKTPAGYDGEAMTVDSVMVRYSAGGRAHVEANDSVTIMNHARRSTNGWNLETLYEHEVENVAKDIIAKLWVSQLFPPVIAGSDTFVTKWCKFEIPPSAIHIGINALWGLKQDAITVTIERQ